jgi:hypothetical protein
VLAGLHEGASEDLADDFSTGIIEGGGDVDGGVGLEMHGGTTTDQESREEE